MCILVLLVFPELGEVLAYHIVPIYRSPLTDKAIEFQS